MGVFELNRIIAQMLTIFIVVAIINAINFIDGLDLLAICVMSIFVFFFEFFALNTTPFENFSILILSSILPLYYFNCRRGEKVFLEMQALCYLGVLLVFTF